MNRMLVVSAMVLLILVTGCKKEESSPPLITQGLPGGGAIAFTDEIKTLEAVLEKTPQDLGALVKLGNLYMDSQRYAEAATMYKRSLELDSANMNVMVDMGTCYRYMGRSDLAIETYRKVIAKQPNHPNAHLNLGVTLFDDMKDYESAIPEFETYLDLEPASPRAAEIRSLISELKKQVR